MSKRQERQALDIFMASAPFQTIRQAEGERLEITHHPNGENQPPDFLVLLGQSRLAVEVIRAMLEDRDRQFQTRMHAEERDASRLESDLRNEIPDCSGIVVHLSGIRGGRYYEDFKRRLKKALTDSLDDLRKGESPQCPWEDPVLEDYLVRFEFDPEMSGKPLCVRYGFTVRADYEPVVGNILRHLKSFNQVAADFTCLIVLLHDVEGLIGNDVDDFYQLLHPQLTCARANEEYVYACERLQGIYVVREQYGPSHFVAQVWPRVRR